MANLSCRTTILSITWGSIQERGYTNVAIVKKNSHKKCLRYTWEYTLGRCHTYCRSRTSIISFTWGNTEERPCKCSLCDQVFLQNINFKHYLGKHTRERPCNCRNCRKAFSQKYHLGIHLRIHTATGEKPYLCNLCDQLSCRSRTASLNTTWENTQGRNHANVAIVKKIR